MVNAVSPKFTREELIQRAFLRIARNVRDMWEESGSSDTRLFMEPLIPDSFVIVGQFLGKASLDRRATNQR
jgi:hypothetical protein